MSNRTYEVVEKIVVLSTTTRARREVRRVRWDGRPDVLLDIRKWRQEVDGSETPSKGVSLNAAEEEALREALIQK